MRQDKYNENFLAQWMNGQLTDQEIAMYVDEDDLDQLKEAVKTVETFETPAFRKEKVWNDIQREISIVQTSKRKPRRVFIWTTVAATAACLALAFSFFFLQPNHSDSLGTDYGEQLSANLPDGSKIKLNAVTDISYESDNWNQNRVVELQGEAFFDVKKGKSFTVETPTGQVQVLGTSFNVCARGGNFKVQCYTGKVSVSHPSADSDIILTPGQGVKINQSGDVLQLEYETKEPHWTNGESYFPNDALTDVIGELERQYGVNFDYTGLDSRVFSGSFVHNNLEQALRMVFEPMNISYGIQKGNTIKLSSAE